MKQLTGWWSSDLSPYLEISTSTGESVNLLVDSGFNGEITLPVALIKKLKLKRRGRIQNELADGSMAWAKAYAGEILWFGQRKRIVVQATNSDEGLLGTELFQGCVVEMDPDEDRVVFRKKTPKVRRGSTK